MLHDRREKIDSKSGKERVIEALKDIGKTVVYLVSAGAVVGIIVYYTPAAIAYTKYLAVYLTGSVALGNAAGLTIAGASGAAVAMKVATTVGDVQEISCGENMTRDAFYSLMRKVVPNITNAQLKEYYETYKASPNVYAVGVTGLAAGAEENGLTEKGDHYNKENGVTIALLQKLSKLD